MSGFPYPGEVAEAVSFAALDGFSEEDHLEAFEVFAASCQAILEDKPPLRAAASPLPDLLAVCQVALAQRPSTRAEAQQFFETYFKPHRLKPDTASGRGFVTGYYEPVVEGALTLDEGFSAPILARPDDLVTFNQGESFVGPDGPLQAAKKTAHGLEPYPERSAIENGALGDRAQPLVWLRDKVETFFIHVQGSARVKLRDGSEVRLTYAGRNGHPYTSIGRILLEEEKIPPEKAGLTGLKQWIRAKGQASGEPGANLMARNKSYIFFALSDVLRPQDGPTGGQGISLTSLRSLAVDRNLWPYGLPMWIEAELPWQSDRPERFRRLMIGQDTGSAILGAARGDIFFGSGDKAGLLAGAIRHPADFTVLLPHDPNRPS